MKSHPTPIKKVKDKNRQTSLNTDNNMEQSEFSYIIGGIINCQTTFGKSLASYFNTFFKMTVKAKQNIPRVHQQENG